MIVDPDGLRRRLREPLPGFEAQLRMAPRPRPVWPPDGPPLRDAAALLLLYPADGDWWLPLTVRASTLPHHTGQVSLPGGRMDAGETIEQAALREAYEEVGLPAAGVTVLGALTPLPIPVSGHLLHPVVGLAASRPAFTLAAAEVDRLVEARLSHLRESATVRWGQRMRTLCWLRSTPRLPRYRQGASLPFRVLFARQSGVQHGSRRRSGAKGTWPCDTRSS